MMECFFLDALGLLNVFSYILANDCFDELLSNEALKYRQSAKMASTLTFECKEHV